MLLGIDITQWSSVFPIGYYTLLLLRTLSDQPETHQDRRPACFGMKHSCSRSSRCSGSGPSSRFQTCHLAIVFCV
ncbi:hypothetical protein SCLCIDRAFT_1097553 [Scleroderma citrinum Foug A]|uniref:Uncharacterized protein n=1 Tax=Scleroderma citrinum Foug A TaxID=1036808 RepID=A0A0C3A0N7_9AGAM|nr:hypothetical protein SCLCIDRAFT_1097553 [Scleroderma citrinum Foug A]